MSHEHLDMQSVEPQRGTTHFPCGFTVLSVSVSLESHSTHFEFISHSPLSGACLLSVMSHPFFLSADTRHSFDNLFHLVCSPVPFLSRSSVVNFAFLKYIQPAISNSCHLVSGLWRCSVSREPANSSSRQQILHSFSNLRFLMWPDLIEKSTMEFLMRLNYRNRNKLLVSLNTCCIPTPVLILIKYFRQWSHSWQTEFPMSQDSEEFNFIITILYIQKHRNFL